MRGRGTHLQLGEFHVFGMQLGAQLLYDGVRSSVALCGLGFPHSLSLPQQKQYHSDCRLVKQEIDNSVACNTVNLPSLSIAAASMQTDPANERNEEVWLD